MPDLHLPFSPHLVQSGSSVFYFNHLVNIFYYILSAPVATCTNMVQQCVQLQPTFIHLLTSFYLCYHHFAFLCTQLQLIWPLNFKILYSFWHILILYATICFIFDSNNAKLDWFEPNILSTPMMEHIPIYPNLDNLFQSCSFLQIPNLSLWSGT